MTSFDYTVRETCRHCGATIRPLPGAITIGEWEGEPWTTGDPGQVVALLCDASGYDLCHQPVETPLEEVVAELRDMIDELAR